MSTAEEQTVLLNRGRVRARVAGLGAAAQATIPGFYAWGVTVAPAAWSHGAPLAAQCSAIVGIVALVVAVVCERRWPRMARPLSIWGLVLASAATWAFTANSLAPTHLEPARGVAGAIGWGLFALASAAPALPPAEAGGRMVPGAPLRPRASLPPADIAYVIGGIICAVALQAIGWRVLVPERAVLVRLTTIAMGLAVLNAAVALAVARHTRRHRSRLKSSLRRAGVLLTILVLLLVGGLALDVVVHLIGDAARPS